MNEFGSPAPLTPAMPVGLPFAPLTFSQIVDRVFRLLRDHFRLFLGVASLPFAVLLLTIGAMEVAILLPLIRQPHNLPNPEVIFSHILPLILIITLLSIVIYAFYFAAANHAATSADLGIRITIIHAYRLTWQHTGRYILLLLLMYLLAFPACVVEGLTAREAIRRSGQLTRHAKGRIFLVMLVIFAICYVLMMVSALAVFALAMFGAFVLPAMHVSLQPPWSYLGFGLIGVVWLVLMFLWMTLPWASSMTALAVIYRDQRLRIDGPLPSTTVQPSGIVG